jgi:hypothetical protein
MEVAECEEEEQERGDEEEEKGRGAEEGLGGGAGGARGLLVRWRWLGKQGDCVHTARLPPTACAIQISRGVAAPPTAQGKLQFSILDFGDMHNMNFMSRQVTWARSHAPRLNFFASHS